MSATINENAVKSVSNQEGQIGSHIKPSEPLEKGGHKPGVLASEADRAPEYHVSTLPAGTAPASHTHAPNNASEVPGGAPSATDTLGGTTSADVHTGLGHPGQGQTSTEIRHDGSHGRKKEGHGLAGVGASGVGNDSKVVDGRDPEFANQRALDKEEGALAGQRGTVGGPAAEERLPETAETVAREAPRD